MTQTRPIYNFPIFISGFPGLNTASNVLTLPEGSNVTASNVIFNYSNIINPRHGLPPWQVAEVNTSDTKTGKYFGIGPSILLTPADVNVATNIFTNTVGDSLVDGQQISFISEGTSLPVGTPAIVAGDTYFVLFVSNTTFRISTTLSGPAIDITSAGTDNFRIILDQSYVNLYYWKTLVSETYVVALKQGNGDASFVEIKPQDYTDPNSVAEYRVIYTTDPTPVPYVSVDPKLPLSPFKFPRYLQTNNGLYVSSTTGWQVIRSSDFPNTEMAKANIPNTVVVKSEFGNDDANNWFADNNAVTFIAVVVRTLANNVEIEGFPSNAFEVINRTGRRRILNVTLHSEAGQKVRLYRTVQYALDQNTINADGTVKHIAAQAAPTVYFQACGDTILDGSGTGLVSVLFNDSVIGTTGVAKSLYTGTDQQGIVSAFSQPPICSDAVEFKGHAFYADVLTLPIGELEILSLNATDNPSTAALNGHSIIIGPKTFTFTPRDFKQLYNSTVASILPYEVNPPATLGSAGANYGDGYGFFNAELGYIAAGSSVISTPPINMRVTAVPYEPNAQIGDATPDGFSKGGANNLVISGSTLTVVISSIHQFNVSAFKAPGIVLLTTPQEATVCSVFKYTAVAINSTDPTKVDFTGFSNAYGDVLAGSYSEVFALWYVPGTGTEDIALYLGAGKIQDDNSGGTGNTDTYGDATRPAYLTPVVPRQRFAQPVAILNSANVGATFTTIGPITTRFFTVNPVMLGATDRSMTTLTDITMQNLARWINSNAATSPLFFAQLNPSFANTIFISSLTYGPINVSVDASSPGIGNKFNPTLSAIPIDVSAFSNPRIKNGLVGSALGFPEQVPLAATTVNVGSSGNRIIRIAATKDDLYCFKEREGVFRIVIQEGTIVKPIATIQQALPLDLTAIPVASEAIQVLDDHVYFLTDRGFCRVINQQVQFISAPIEQDVKTATARTPTFDGIRSFVDRAKRIYVCTFPRTNVDGTSTTFVFNTKTEMWSTFTTAFDWVVTDVIGRQTALTDDFLIKGQPILTTKQLNASNFDDRFVRVWQYLRQEQFTGQETDNVYDTGFNQVIDTFGNDVTIQVGTFNVVDSSFDQFDEIMTGFSTATLSGGSIVLTRTKGASPNYPHIPGNYFNEFVNRLRNEQLYYSTTVNNVENVLIPVTFSAVIDNSSTSGITLTPIVSNLILAPSATVDSIMVGVNTRLDFVPFHNSTPETLKMFSKFMCHYQDRPEANSLPSTLYLSFKVDNQPQFSDQTIFDTVVVGRTIYETLIPLTATRGRFLSARVEHNQPLEYWSLNGAAFVYRETGSSRVSTK